MAKVFDYMVDETGDLLIQGGDFARGESTRKHQEHLLLAAPTNIFYEPSTGVGIGNYILDDATNDEVQSDIQKEFEADGMEVEILTVAGLTNINIQAAYK
jgi:hypothetical protein